ncbi:MAG TPA: glycosyltransferase family 1 protein, partial [Gemmatimonadales bacterium]|nr:glycosyltransferase family 1 protein [Gemmatimonadales bacterium]
MRILYFSDTFLPEINGVTTVLATMRDGLLARGHEVRMVVPGYGTPTANETGLRRIPGVPCPGYSAVRLSWPWGRGIGAWAAGFAPDLVHVATEGPIGLFGRAFALRHDLPLVTSFHTDFPRYAAHYLGKLATGPVRGYLRWFHRPALATQTPSAVTRDELHLMRIPQALVWGAAVDARRFTPSLRSETRRAELGGTGRVMVLHVGRLAVEKDPGTLIESFRQAHAMLGNAAVFCVAGAGPEAESVQRALPFARHFGFLSRDKLAELYADADLFVFPSPTETCGLVALEAMASGLPVIGAAAGGIRESIMPEITGLLIEPGDANEFAGAIESLVRDGER